MDSYVIILCGLGPLAGLLALAVWRDLASYRIPNAIVFGGTAIAFILHAVLPAGAGFLGALPGGLGVQAALGGMTVGLLAMLPLYFMGAAGAGDAKLMAMVGAFFGPGDAFGAVVATYLAGMALALFAMRRSAVMVAAMKNLRLIASSAFARMVWADGPRFNPRTDTAAKLPYSLPIAVGAAGWAAWRICA